MTTRSTVQQVMTQAIVGAMTVSIFSTALGILVAGAGLEAIPAGIAGAKATETGINDLISAFGASIVNKAVKNVGSDDIVALAMEVERLYIEWMNNTYGVWETEQGLANAPAGDVRAAREIAATLRAKGVKPASTEQVKQKVVGEGKLKSARVAQPVKDTKTGIVYQSKAKAGMSVAAEYDLDPKNHFIWYEVIKKDPIRFVRVTSEEASKSAPSPALVPQPATTKASKLELVRRYLPEYIQVLREWENKKPKKFVEAVEVIVAPATFNPSAQGDFAATMSFSWDGVTLTQGPAYSYDTMITVVKSPYERVVDVPQGHRVWITTYDGQWGGYWSRVHVYVHKDDPAAIQLLPAGR